MNLTTLSNKLENIHMSLRIEPITYQNQTSHWVNVYDLNNALCASINNIRLGEVEYYEGGTNFSKVHSYALEYSRTPLIDRCISDYKEASK